ncbi:hypothetical protein J437_LFUL002076 [Ladona fulva]|uniref:PDEase domain-containing protein n=1 Tax=Ladona fulva TaxID=123851 RepID=A0A8K0NZG4_LADFU|nr:hypothetical protein J437_LFUL002076 [Ladona fulva]
MIYFAKEAFITSNVTIYFIKEAAFVISCLCHDSDHLGVSNSFLQLTKHELSQLYETSPLENHHFELAVAFIHRVGLFDHWTKKDFNLLMNNVKNNILSTDLAVFFESRNMVLRLQKKKAFKLHLNKHRYVIGCGIWGRLTKQQNKEAAFFRMLLKRIVMNGCDLSANGKPFPYSKDIAYRISEEFYLQVRTIGSNSMHQYLSLRREIEWRIQEGAPGRRSGEGNGLLSRQHDESRPSIQTAGGADQLPFCDRTTLLQSVGYSDSQHERASRRKFVTKKWGNLSPLLADIFMDFIEEKIFNYGSCLTSHVKCWFRNETNAPPPPLFRESRQRIHTNLFLPSASLHLAHLPPFCLPPR